jgi:lipid A 3-O-deacylase
MPLDALPRSSSVSSAACMHSFLKITLLGFATVAAVFAEESKPLPPWETGAVDVESGVLWQIGTGTPLSYRLVPTQLSWRSREFIGHGFSDGSRLIVRHRLTLIGTSILQGPESHYVGFSGSPSVEWWDKTGRWSLFTGAGGGFGLIDSRGVKGGQGQDFTLNWFIRGGIEYVTARNLRLSAGIMYQHLSNGGQTDPNPGIDALGFTLGCGWGF